MSKKGSPKKDKKKGSVKKEEFDDEPEPWIRELSTLIINDSSWSCNVSFLAESDPHVTTYTRVFTEIASRDNHVRPVIKVITSASLAQSTIENSYSNMDKNVRATPFKRLCLEAVKYCTLEGFNLDIPVILLAYLIKYHISSLKENNCQDYKAKNEYESRKQKAEEESAMNIKALYNASSEKGNSKKEKPKKETGSKKKPGSKGEAVSKFTQLRKRSEEILDSSFLRDEPYEGPHLYIIISGFSRPELILEILKLGIPLDSLIRVHTFVTSDGNELQVKMKETIERILNTRTSKSKFKRKYSNPFEQFYLEETRITYFWKELYQILIHSDNVTLFKDTLFLNFYPKLRLNINVPKSEEMLVWDSLQNSIYDQFSYLQYDIQDIKRQHQNYVKKLNTVEFCHDRTFTWDDMNVYISKVDGVPPQLLNVPFILNAILCQVETINEMIDGTFDDKISLGSQSAKSEQLDDFVQFIKNLDSANDLFTKENSKNIFTNGRNCPEVLMYGDVIGISTYWWRKYYYIKNDTCKVLQRFWENYLGIDPLPVEQNEISETDESIFNTFKNTQYKDHTILHKLYHLPCNHEFVVVENKAAVFCFGNEVVSTTSDNDIKSTFSYQVSPSYPDKCIQVTEPNSLFINQFYDSHGYCYEEMASDVLVQKLTELLENYNCCDVERDDVNDTFLLKFHNRKTCTNEDHFVGNLRTATALRDFYDYIIEEDFDWLDEQEKLYILLSEEREIINNEEGNYQKIMLKNKLDDKIDKLCAEHNFVLKSAIKNEQMEKCCSNADDQLSVQVSAQIGNLEALEYEREIKYKKLEAFDIDVPNRVQFSERYEDFIFSKYSKLRIKILSQLYKEDSIFIQNTSYGITLYYFKPHGKVEGISFHIIHESGMIIYVQDLIMENAVNNLYFNNNGTQSCTSDSANSAKYPINTTGDLFTKNFCYKLTMSWPNTLYFETVNKSEIPVYVKQHYLNRSACSLKGEIYRCYLVNGQLLKFMDDNSVYIYYPNSEIYHCKSLAFNENHIVSTVSEHYEETKSRNKSKQHKPKHESKEEVNVEDKKIPLPVLLSVGSYEVTLVTGRRYAVDNGEEKELEPLLMQTFTDIQRGTIRTERSDGTVVTHTYNGTTVVDFPDKTRITTTAYFGQLVTVSGVSDEFKSSTPSSNSELNCFKVSQQSNESKRDQQPNLSKTSQKSILSKRGQSSNKSSSSKQLNLQNNNKQSFDSMKDKDYLTNVPEECIDESESFVMIDVEYLTENPEFISVSYDTKNEIINLDLPFNTNIEVSSDGCHYINFNNDAQVLTTPNEVLIKEFNNNQLSRESKITTTKGNENSVFFSIRDTNGSELKIQNNGKTQVEAADDLKTVCNCKLIENDHYFIVNKYLYGAEVFSPALFDNCVKEVMETKNCVTHDYATADHHSVTVLRPLFQKETPEIFKSFQPIDFYLRSEPPSTYNFGSYGYAPFPKKLSCENIVTIPDAFLIRQINRVNCNNYLKRESFFKSKKYGDMIRMGRDSCKALEIYKQGDIRYVRADEEFVYFLKNNLMPHLISRTRWRILRSKQRCLIKEYKVALRNKQLLPYFQSAKGVIHLIMAEILSLAIVKSEKNSDSFMLKKLLKIPLIDLSDHDLGFLHDMLKQTPNSLCSCDDSARKCVLWVILLAGRTMQEFFPDMISVLEAHSKPVLTRVMCETPKKTEKQGFSIILKTLLMKSMELLTESDLDTLHDVMKYLLQRTNQLCSCEKVNTVCKLRTLLVAGRTLHNFFPNMSSVFETYKLPIN